MPFDKPERTHNSPPLVYHRSVARRQGLFFREVLYAVVPDKSFRC
jgi:hypothetical protein